jgi:photosystem II stability/assembly factor-like uncharacterized protein
VVTVNADGDPVVMISTGGRFETSHPPAVWMTDDNGDSWTKITELEILDYDYILDLEVYENFRYASTGTYVSSFEQGSGYSRAPGEGDPDLGDVWRIALSATEDTEGGYVGRFETVLSKLQELAEHSGQHDFGIVPYDSFLYCYDDVQSFQFQVRRPQWGDDKSWDDVTGEGLIFQLEHNNMVRPAYSQIRGSRPNMIYLLGPSAGEERDVSRYYNYPEISQSPWGRVEGTADAQSMYASAARSAKAFAELEDQGPYTDLQFEILETEKCFFHGGNADSDYPRCWGLGDIVTGYFHSLQADYKIEKVRISAGGGDATYTVHPTFKQSGEIVEDELETAFAIGLVTDAGAPTGIKGAQIWRTKDSGESWVLMQELDDPVDMSRGNIPTNNGDELIAAFGDFGTTFEWWKSSTGQQWLQMDQAGVAGTVRQMITAANGNIVCGVNEKYYISTDGGTQYSYTDTCGGNSIQSFCLATDGTLYSGSSHAGFTGQVWRSTDNGVNWAQRNVTALADFPASIIEAANGNLVLGTDAKDVQYSTDGGVTWSAPLATGAGSWLNCLLLMNNGYLIMSSLKGEIFRSLDHGVTWTKIHTFSGAGAIYSVVQIADATLLAIEDVRVHRSTDWGESWEMVFENTDLYRFYMLGAPWVVLES